MHPKLSFATAHIAALRANTALLSVLDGLGSAVALLASFLMATKSEYSFLVYPCFCASSILLLTHNYLSRIWGQSFMQTGFLITNFIGLYYYW